MFLIILRLIKRIHMQLEIIIKSGLKSKLILQNRLGFALYIISKVDLSLT